MRTKLFHSILLASVAAACGQHEEHGHDAAAGDGHGDHEHLGPHDGHLLEIGDGVAHLEILHDCEAGSLTVHVLGADARTPLAPDAPPVLKLATDEGPRELAGEPLAGDGGPGSAFRWSSPALEGEEVRGRFAVEIDGKRYAPDLKHGH